MMEGARRLSTAERYCHDCPAYDGSIMNDVGKIRAGVAQWRTWCKVQNLLDDGDNGAAVAMGLDVGKVKRVDGCLSMIELGKVK